MKLGTIVTTNFFICFAVTVTGVYLKITHSAAADRWLTVGIFASMMFTMAAIIEVRTSKQTDHTEKTVWALACLFFSLIAGLVYVLMGGERFAAHS